MTHAVGTVIKQCCCIDLCLIFIAALQTLLCRQNPMMIDDNGGATGRQ